MLLRIKSLISINASALIFLKLLLTPTWVQSSPIITTIRCLLRNNPMTTKRWMSNPKWTTNINNSIMSTPNNNNSHNNNTRVITITIMLHVPISLQPNKTLFRHNWIFVPLIRNRQTKTLNLNNNEREPHY